MLEERRNESFHWKHKLDELNQVTEADVVDKVAAWEKLHARLSSRPRSKRALWYWSAAACLLLLLASQWLRVKQEKDVVKNSDKLRQEKAPQTKATIQAIKIVEIPVRASSPKQHSNTTKTHKALLLRKQKIVLTDSVIATTTSRRELYPDTLSNTFQHQDTIALVATIPVKKKLRVIHINELGRPLQEENDFARSNSGPAVSQKTFNQNVFRGFTGSRNASDDIIKIKLSPSN